MECLQINGRENRKHGLSFDAILLSRSQSGSQSDNFDFFSVTARFCLPVDEEKHYLRGMPGTTMVKSVQTAKTPKVLVIDVGGTNIKMLTTGQKEPRKIPSGAAQNSVRAHDDGGQDGAGGQRVREGLEV